VTHASAPGATILEGHTVPDIIPTTPFLGFHVEEGTILITTAALMGGTHEDEDVICPAGSFGRVTDVKIVPDGVSITITVQAGQSAETGEDLWIVNTFDPSDHEPRYPFVRADASGADLAAIRAAVRVHDDRLNDGVGDEAPKSPDGDDYNTIFSLIMNGVPVQPQVSGNSRTYKVLLQQYVEEVAEVLVTIPDGDGLDDEEAVAQARILAKRKADTATWTPGDDAQGVEVYAVLDSAGETVWER
jgi:hypothetical protein